MSHLKNSLEEKKLIIKANIYRTLNKNQVLFQGALYELNWSSITSQEFKVIISIIDGKAKDVRV